jgi:hypothetical protein
MITIFLELLQKFSGHGSAEFPGICCFFGSGPLTIGQLPPWFMGVVILAKGLQGLERWDIVQKICQFSARTPILAVVEKHFKKMWVFLG